MDNFYISQTDSQLQAILNKIQPLAETNDMGSLGFGFGVCDTDPETVAKTVTLTNMILTVGGIIAVRFTKPINANNATLSVNSGTAKPIYINGEVLQPYTVRGGMTLVMAYDGTRFNIIAMMGLENSGSPSDLYVDMGLPSGTLWAKKNIDVTQPDGFAASEYQYGCSFFSWGNVQGHNPSGDTFDYNFSNNTYPSTPGAALNGDFSPSFDAARVNCRAPWRLPSTEEFAELFNNIDYVDANGDVISGTNKLTTINSITGIRLKSKTNGNTIFIPCSGQGTDSSWNYYGNYGSYLTSSLISPTTIRILYFYSDSVDPQNNANVRFFGMPVRPVQ